MRLIGDKTLLFVELSIDEVQSDENDENDVDDEMQSDAGKHGDVVENHRVISGIH